LNKGFVENKESHENRAYRVLSDSLRRLLHFNIPTAMERMVDRDREWLDSKKADSELTRYVRAMSLIWNEDASYEDFEAAHQIFRRLHHDIPASSEYRIYYLYTQGVIDLEKKKDSIARLSEIIGVEPDNKLALYLRGRLNEYH
jgi:hypothetical protein